MKLNYEYTEKEYKRSLIKSRKINNIILFVIGMAVYLYLTLNKTPLWYIPIFIIILILVIILLNLLYVGLTMKIKYEQKKIKMINNTYGKYCLELTPNKFSLTVNRSKVDYKYNNIKKFKVKKDSFQIKFYKSRDNLIFEKRLFDETEYNKAIEYFKDRIK